MFSEGRLVPLVRKTQPDSQSFRAEALSPVQAGPQGSAALLMTQKGPSLDPLATVTLSKARLRLGAWGFPQHEGWKRVCASHMKETFGREGEQGTPR